MKVIRQDDETYSVEILDQVHHGLPSAAAAWRVAIGYLATRHMKLCLITNDLTDSVQELLEGVRDLSERVAALEAAVRLPHKKEAA